MQALQKAQAKQAQQEVMQTQTDLEKLIHEAPLPVMPVPQINVSWSLKICGTQTQANHQTT